MLRFFGCQTFSRSRRLVDLILLYRLPVNSLIGSRSSKTMQSVLYNIMLNNLHQIGIVVQCMSAYSCIHFN